MTGIETFKIDSDGCREIGLRCPHCDSFDAYKYKFYFGGAITKEGVEKCTNCGGQFYWKEDLTSQTLSDRI